MNRRDRCKLSALGIAEESSVNCSLSNVKKGDKIVISGGIKFLQDFSLWGGKFGDLIFEVEGIINGYLSLRADGYGGKPYGNGSILVSSEYNENLSIVG